MSTTNTLQDPTEILLLITETLQEIPDPTLLIKTKLREILRPVNTMEDLTKLIDLAGYIRIPFPAIRLKDLEKNLIKARFYVNHLEENYI